MVGTDIGNTYKGQQGTGFATIAPYSPQVDLSLLEMQQRKEAAAAAEKKAKEAKLMAAYADLGKIKPDNWYVHDEYVSNMMTGLMDLGASYIARGIDPMTDPAAKDFQKLMVETTRTTEYSKQFKAQFEDIQKAYKNGEDLENWDEISLYLHNPDLPGMVNGDYGKMPPPIFKKPEVSVLKSINEVWKMWDENNKGQVPTPDDAGKLAEKLVSDPLYSGGFSSTGSKQKQMYDALPKAQKDAYEASGVANGRDGYTQYVADDLYAAKNPYFNLEEDVLAASDFINTSDWELENDDVTRKGSSIKQSDAELRQILRGRLRPGAVLREVQQRKYGDINKDITFNIKAAEDYYFPKFKKNIATKFSKTYDEAGKEGKKTEASFTNWYNDITSGDGDKFIAAAPYLDKDRLARFVPDMPRDARIGNIKYYNDGRMELVIVNERGRELSTRKLMVADIPKEMLKNAYMDQYKGTNRNYETTETGANTADNIATPSKKATPDTADDLK